LLQRHPAVARPIWNTYYNLFHQERAAFRKGAVGGRDQAFTEVFAHNEWQCGESVSGEGSSIVNTAQVRKYLPQVIKRYGARSLLDAPCGDFNWMKVVQLPEGVTYIGADIVDELIDDLSRNFAGVGRKFEKLDVVEDPLPEVDMWLCRHLSYHLPNDDLLKMLRNFKRSNVKYLLTTNVNFARENLDTNFGGYHFINLRKPPFNLPRPLYQFDDYVLLGPPNVLALWSREQIPEL
jgi:hypothetical protein